MLTKTFTTVKTSLGKSSYPIYIGKNLLNDIGKFFSRHISPSAVVVITDRNVARKYLRSFETQCKRISVKVYSIVLEPGEKQKSLNAAEKIYTKLLGWNIDRTAVIVALGGGVIGDLAGFIAATYQRGIAFVQTPTTLLAQVDSSVGGKVGINHPAAKNMIGAFYQPRFVLIDTEILKTLPKRELISGMAEVIKYGVILDKNFFLQIEKNIERALKNDPKIISNYIKRSCELKAYVVSRDEKEEHLRAILNFGHTIGHALEHAGKYSLLKHGEAIFYGMIAETYIAQRMNMISPIDSERLERLIERLALPSLSSLRWNMDSLMAAMRKDKKTKNGTIRMVLPHSIGKVSLPISVDEVLAREALHYLKSYAV